MQTTPSAGRRLPPLEPYLERLSPSAARAYLDAYRRAGLVVPLSEPQAAIVRRRASGRSA